MKDIVKSFLPWILYFIIAGHTQASLDIAVIIACITTLLLQRQGLKKGFVMDWGSLIFFIFLFFAIVVIKNQWIINHDWVFSNGSLAAIAFISVLIRKPFTMQYAKEQVAKEYWQTSTFIRINYILTTTWGVLFLLCIVPHFLKLYWPFFDNHYSPFYTYIPSIFGIWFTAKFPAWYQKYRRTH